jgi:hypothetical protein
MAEEPDVIRHRIEETRGSLAEKLETLEGQVKGAVGAVTDTIETVKHTVEHTVESVKSGVENTVDTVKETFDLSRQVDRHPWAAVGCTFLAGAATGYFLIGPRYRRSHYPGGIPGMNHLIPGYRSGPVPAPAAEPPRREYRSEPSRPGVLSNLLGSFEGELDKIKQTAIGALMGVARDALRQALPPSLAPNVTEIMDDITRRAGGEPVRGPVLQREGEGDRAHGTY